jgi:hypothetical protein
LARRVTLAASLARSAASNLAMTVYACAIATDDELVAEFCAPVDADVVGPHWFLAQIMHRC